MTRVNILLTLAALAVLTMQFLSNWIGAKLPVSEAMICVVAGIVIAWIGLTRLDLFPDPRRVLEVLARLTVAISVVEVAMRLPELYFPRHKREIFVVLGPLMVLMWLCTGLILYVTLGLPFWVAMLIGASVTPTDPVLAGSIINGKAARDKLPKRVRFLISAESGANDGLAYPFVFLAIFLLRHSPGEALKLWTLKAVLWDVLCAVALGLAIGGVTGKIFCILRKGGYVGKGSASLTVTVTLSMLSVGAIGLIGSNGILGSFAAGLAFKMVADIVERQEDFQESIKRFFNIPLLILFGMMLPFAAWWRTGGALILAILGVLLLRRLPGVFLLNPWIGSFKGRADALFAGWFGPIGMASLYYVLLVSREMHDERVWAIGTALIIASIFAHGVTSRPFVHLYGRLAAKIDPAEG